MYLKHWSALFFIIVTSFCLYLSCSQVTGSNPYDESKTEIFLVLKSSQNIINDEVIIDTTGKIMGYGVAINLPKNVDSIQIETVAQAESNEHLLNTIYNSDTLNSNDTVWNSIVLNDTGTILFIAKAYVKNWKIISDTVRLTAFARPINNSPTFIEISNRYLVSSQSCTLTVTATDIDSPAQTLSFSALKTPGGGSFNIQSRIFIWTAPASFTVNDSVVFRVEDNGYPVKSDTLTVHFIPVVDTVKQPPKWADDTIKLSANPGTTLTLTLADKCTDAQDDSLEFYLVNGLPPSGDTIVNGSYSFKPVITDTGLIYYPLIIAKNKFNLTDTVTVKFMVKTIDITPPYMKLVSPSSDSAVISSSAYQVKILCIDNSGVASVKCEMGNDTFAIAKADSVYSAAISGLKMGWNRLSFIATDASLQANRDTMFVDIKYDSTMTDSTAPVIKIKVPGTDSTGTNSNSYAVILSCNDNSGVASVTGVMETASFNGTKSSDALWTVTITGLTVNVYNMIIFTAKDNSANANKATDTIWIKYDPNMLDSIGPTFKQVSGPVTGSIIKAPVVTIVDSIFDPSGIDSVYWSLNGVKAGMLTAGSDNKYTLIDSLTSYHSNRIAIFAQDKSKQANKDSTIILLDYNAVPVINDTSISIKEDTLISFNLPGSDLDDTLTGWTIVSAARNGTAALATNPAKMVTYTPNGNFYGKDTFSFMAGDGTVFDTGYVYIVVTGVNDAPVISKNLGLTVNEGDTGKITAARLDFSDVDNASSDFIISFPALPKNGKLMNSNTAILTSTNLAYTDISSGTLKYIHDDSKTAADSFTVSVSDGIVSTTGTFKISISLRDDPPVFSKTGTQMLDSVGVGNYYRDTVMLTDPENALSNMTVKMTPSAAGMSFNSTTGAITIDWCIDVFKYTIGQSIPCTISVVDGSNKVSLAWAVAVKSHKWTKVMIGTTASSYFSATNQFAAKDSFVFFSGKTYTGIYKCDLSNNSTWSLIKSLPQYFFYMQATDTMLAVFNGTVSYIHGSNNFFKFNASTGAQADSFYAGTSIFNVNFSVDKSCNIFYPKTSGDTCRIMKNTSTGFDYIGISSTYSEVFANIASTENNTYAINYAYTDSSIVGGYNRKVYWVILFRISNPLSTSSTSNNISLDLDGTYSRGSTAFPIITDNNDGDTLFVSNKSRSIRVINFSNSSSPVMEAVASAPEVMLSGSVGWGLSSDTVAFTQNGFATTSSESFEAGFTPKTVKMSGDKKAIFVIGSDYTIYRY